VEAIKNLFRKLLPHQHPIRLFFHKVVAIAAAFRYGFPANGMTVIAVTGTKGKTSTSNMIHKIFTEAGKKTGLLTTINFKVGEDEERNTTNHTTIGPFQLQKKIREMRDAQCEVLVVEVTSHAIVQSRLWGINVDTVVFTNLSQDHLDYHGTMEEYRNAKGLLFEALNHSPRKVGVSKISVVNQDDAEHEYFNKFPADQLFEYGIVKGSYTARTVEPYAEGNRFLLRIPNGELPIDLKIPGRMNVYNALAAATVATAHRINLATIQKALESMKPLPGRLEVIEEGQPFTVVVDFAHTEESLKQVLQMFRELTKGKLIVVFGATGERDTGKRPKMGAVAHQYADHIVLTNDDPYGEDPLKIAEMVRGGIPRHEGQGFWQVLNRKEAIRLGLSLAQEAADTVIVAGKGAEAYQLLGNQRIPHDDRLVVREVLSKAIDIAL
jgi:UDP-N-acetylmuramoyl-L-alanyl-D-glutamate--2,6-diaminopimelate ligase